MDCKRFTQWIDYTDAQIAALERAFEIIETDPRAAELYRADVANLADPTKPAEIQADKEELAKLFDGNPHIFALAVLMGRMDWLVGQYQAMGMPETVLKDTLKDVTLWMKVCMNVSGKVGMIEYGWLALSFRMWLFRVGALEFIRARYNADFGDETAEPTLEVHIPEGADLSPESVRASMKAAVAFFEKYYDWHPTKLTCESWLLDEALSKALPGSKVAMFGNMFTRTGKIANPAQTIERVFGFNVTDYRQGPRDTRLQRAIAQWLDDGGECCEGIGYIPVEEIL